MGAEVIVPDDAAEAFRRAKTEAGSVCVGADIDGLRAAAPLIVAAGLTNLADEMAQRTVTEEDVRAQVARILGRSDEWCNCQAVHGTVNYPGPWHPAGDTPFCPARASELRGEGQS